MGCCGQSRNELQVAMPAALRPAWPMPAVQGPDAPAATAGGARAVVLRYRERARVLVRGPVTGQAYAFSAGQPTQPVDARDAEALLRTRHFVRA